MKSLNTLLVLIALVLGTSTCTYSQHIILIEDETHHCFTEGQTKFLVSQTKSNITNKDQAIDLKRASEYQQKEIERLNKDLATKDSIIQAKDEQLAAKDSIGVINDEIIDIVDEDNKKLKRKKKWEKAWKEWLRPTVIAVASFLTGFGAGSISK